MKQYKFYIIILMVGILLLSVGFAVFNKQLNITNTKSVITTSNNLNVHFPTSGSITVTNSTDSSGTAMTLNDGNSLSISGLTANLSGGNSWVTFSTTIYNDAPYTAYLKSVTFSNSSPTCTAVNGVLAASAVTAACGNMIITLTYGTTNYTSTKNNITTNNSIAANGNKSISIKVQYNSSTVLDDDIKVDFGNITLNFSSVN